MISTSVHLDEGKYEVFRYEISEMTNSIVIRTEKDHAYPSITLFVNSPERAKLIEIALTTPIIPIKSCKTDLPGYNGDTLCNHPLPGLGGRCFLPSGHAGRCESD